MTKKVIVIASAVIAILYSVYLTIGTVGTLVLALRYGLYEYHALDRGPAGNFATSLIMELLILFVSLLVLFKVRPPKLLRILIVIISVIIVLLSILTAGVYTFVVIKGNTYRTIDTEYIIFTLGQSAVLITLLTYIRRALRKDGVPAERERSPATHCGAESQLSPAPSGARQRKDESL